MRKLSMLLSFWLEAFSYCWDQGLFRVHFLHKWFITTFSDHINLGQLENWEWNWSSEKNLNATPERPTLICVNWHVGGHFLQFIDMVLKLDSIIFDVILAFTDTHWQFVLVLKENYVPGHS